MDKDLSFIYAKKKLILAPMDGITDIAFREICEEMGASFTVSEMISSDALVRGKVKPVSYIRGSLKINIVQLFGNDPIIFLKAAKMIENEVDGIDVNFGCPSSRLVNNRMGGWLLNDPLRIYEIIRTLSENLSVPVSAKIRIGFNDFSLEKYKFVLRMIEKGGASFITIHGRTVKQGFSGVSDWDAILMAKKVVGIPIIGNGDVRRKDDLDKLEYVDAIMVGRAAIGNPFIFNDFRIPTFSERVSIAKDYLVRASKYSIEFSRIRLNVGYFFKGVEGGKALRSKIFNTKDLVSLRKVLDSLN